ncbi:hypothetical protein BU23DRAFT_663829 [Bimuria novae-zelandiae CBS 107.79]|uniref:Amidase domain-containing protein n=1 Tax=Bimuria novae-zelandiae CBS 107.79 TaxID=1447943 RepID=A0A6A5UTF3_9PLEO|nr:hypothetical protein BU23DRAFT_663829 [Bimuria novae-zelandiae CBS 107.79]
MLSFNAFGRAALFSHFGKAAINPEYQSLLWIYEGKNFWAPLDLNSRNFALESPAGTAPETLIKRDAVYRNGQYHACTVLTLDGIISAVTISEKLKDYKAIEGDVWSEEQFGQCLFVRSSSNTSPPVDLSSLTNHTAAVFVIAGSSGLLNGPCVASIGPSLSDVNLAPAYGLHEDVWDSFMSGSIPTDASAGSHLTMQVSFPGTRTPAIIIPSRIASAASPADAGLLQNSTLRPKNYTTQIVEKSLAGSAQLVGKTRTTHSLWERPTMAQRPTIWTHGIRVGTATRALGAAAVEAAPPQQLMNGSTSLLDPTLPTHGIFNLTGILVAIAEQDTPGFLARSPSIFTRLGKWWAKDAPLEDEADRPLPSQLLYYANEAPLVQPEAEALKLAFFANVSAALNLSASSINMTENWISEGPASNQSISEYMTYVYSDQNSVQFYEKIGLELDELYGTYNNGSHFPTDPMVNGTCYDAHNGTTQARLPESIRRCEAFASWFNEKILPRSNTTCSESIFAHSLHIAPGYKKVMPAGPHVASYYWNGVWVNYAGIPEIVVPIG